MVCCIGMLNQAVRRVDNWPRYVHGCDLVAHLANDRTRAGYDWGYAVAPGHPGAYMGAYPCVVLCHLYGSLYGCGLVLRPHKCVQVGGRMDTARLRLDMWQLGVVCDLAIGVSRCPR